MTKIDYLISSAMPHQKNIVLNTHLFHVLAAYFQNYQVFNKHTMNIFGNYDAIIIDQSDLDSVQLLYEKFLCPIYVIDNISLEANQQHTEYWQNLTNLFNQYSLYYKAVFVAIDYQTYVNSNYAHNFYINLSDKESWEKLI